MRYNKKRTTITTNFTDQADKPGVETWRCKRGAR
jgi:hypothetical protein